MADRPIFNQALQSFKSIQSGISDRLATLRETRPERLEAVTQPAKSQLGQQMGLARRSVGIEGSLGSQQRTDIALNKELGEQDIEMRAMTDLANQEGGMQNLETQFTGLINEMASTGFSQELAGLREAMNVYMAKEGAALDSAQLAAQSRGATMAMWGRFAQAAGMEFGRGGSTPTQSQFDSAGSGFGYSSPYSTAGFGAGGIY